MAKLQPLKIGELTAPVPVIQGGMGVGISLSGLAGAVAAEGGVGIISTAQIGFREPDFDEDPIGANLRAIGKEIEKAREIDWTIRRQRGKSAKQNKESRTEENTRQDTDWKNNGEACEDRGIIGVNIMVATRRYEEYVKAAVAAGADLIISGAGLPMTLPELVKGSQTKIAPIVSSLKSAQVILRYWLKKYDRLPDLVVIEGPRAGGHLGFSYEELQGIEEPEKVSAYEEKIQTIVEHVKTQGREHGQEIPVVAAGGIYTREDAERMAALGADGVQMATRFVTTYECDAPDAYKQAYIHAAREDITLVKSPVGMPGRAIRNDFLKRAEQGKIPHGKCHLCVSTCKPAETPYCITDALVNAARGDVGNALLFCGTNAYRATKLEHVRDILDEMRAE